MYIVIEKNTGNIIHRNPAPLRQRLTPKEIFVGFDADTMEIAAIDGPLPQHYKIEEGIIKPLTLEEMIADGIIKLLPGQKIKDGQIVEKTVSEKVEEGMLTLKPHQKIIGEGNGERIVDKTTDEKIAEGLISLAPHQKVVGEGDESKIVDKTLSEKVKEGLLTLEPGQKIVGEGEKEHIQLKSIQEQVEDGTLQLDPHQKVEGDGIVEKTDRELLDEGLIALPEFKQKRIKYFSFEALRIRSTFLPDYKIQNAGLGMYDDTKTVAIKNTVQAFKDEFKRVKAAIENAADLDAVEAVKAKFPDKLVEQ